jgi:hypothetical protein
MYFFVDESGHTGPNLFDESQPMLFYGVLSSKFNIDVVGEEAVKRMRKLLSATRLHAAELGNRRLVEIAPALTKLQEKLDLRFDLYRIAKPDHAIICFFDQVFDQGLNPAMTWTGYWTPLRYVLLLKVAWLFDEAMAKKAWDARLELDDKKSDKLVVDVCEELRVRLYKLPDARSRELLGGALLWAIKNPSELFYNAKTKKDKLSIMPNVVGFQSVMMGIAARMQNSSRKSARIVVDQQTQFNRAQKNLHDYYIALSKVKHEIGPGLPEMNLKKLPKTPIEFLAGEKSYGLELVDIYLWIFKRLIEEKEVAPELAMLVRPYIRRGRMDEVSINALANRWEKWLQELPEPSEEQLIKAREIHDFDEQRRLDALESMKGTNHTLAGPA